MSKGLGQWYFPNSPYAGQWPFPNIVEAGQGFFNWHNMIGVPFTAHVPPAVEPFCPSGNGAKAPERVEVTTESITAQGPVTLPVTEPQGPMGIPMWLWILAAGLIGYWVFVVRK